MILGDDPKQLHKLRIEIEEYLHDNLKLSLRKVDPKPEKRNGSFKYSKLIAIEVLILSGMSFTIPIPLFGRESKRTYVGRQPS